jgi:hypothetical protein
MPTPTYTPLATVTLGSTASSVTFDNIPNNYRDLVLVIRGGNTGGSGLNNIFVSLNNDSTNSNYAMVQMSGPGTSTQSSAESNFSRMLNYWGFQENNLNSVITTQFIDYSTTDKHKAFLTKSSNSDNGVSVLVNRWANTEAITKIGIAPGANSFIVNSTFSIYGILA